MSQPEWIEKTPEQLVHELSDHTALLREGLDKAKQGDIKYLKTVAVQLRILLVEKSRRTKPLLFHIAKMYGRIPMVNIFVPPDSEDMIPLEEQLNKELVIAEEGRIRFTRADVIKKYAEQYGGAHQALRVEKDYHAVKDGSPLRLEGYDPIEYGLIRFGDAVHGCCKSLLDNINGKRTSPYILLP